MFSPPQIFFFFSGNPKPSREDDAHDFLLGPASDPLVRLLAYRFMAELRADPSRLLPLLRLLPVPGGQARPLEPDRRRTEARHPRRRDPAAAEKSRREILGGEDRRDGPVWDQFWGGVLADAGDHVV